VVWLQHLASYSLLVHQSFSFVQIIQTSQLTQKDSAFGSMKSSYDPPFIVSSFYLKCLQIFMNSLSHQRSHCKQQTHLLEDKPNQSSHINAEWTKVPLPLASPAQSNLDFYLPTQALSQSSLFLHQDLCNGGKWKDQKYTTVWFLKVSQNYYSQKVILLQLWWIQLLGPL